MQQLQQAGRWLQGALRLAPDWAVTLLILGLAVVIALLVHGIFFRLLTRAVARLDLFWRSLVSRTGGMLRLGAIMLALIPAARVAPMTDAEAGMLGHALLIGLIVLVAWAASTAIHIWMTLHLRRFKLDAEDNLLARKHVTQTRILRRVVNILLVVVAVGAVLMTFEGVRQYGISLLASAGAAGIIVGLALQTMLKNLLAGIQLALTQPIRIDDVVIVEGEWGRIEEITSTYVVVKIWDWRRLIVPLSYFIERPFENWTRESASIIGTVMIYLDYSVPVEAVRTRAREVAESSPLWDRQVFAVQVTDFRETVMEVRIIVGARSAGDAFELRCDLREQIIGYLQREHPDALPRTRLELGAGTAPAQNGRAGPAGGPG